jgi:hypothetical protein
MRKRLSERLTLNSLRLDISLMSDDRVLIPRILFF